MNNFLYGVIFCAAVTMTVQDWMGLEGYIEHVRNYWIDLPWWVGACLALIALYSAVTKRNDR